MAWYNFWKKKAQKEEIPPSVHTIVPTLGVTSQTKIQRSEFRNGMWVMTTKGIGIIFELDNKSNKVLIHLVDPKTGETVNATIEDRQAFRQAKLSEIPACRKVGITEETATYLGYM